MATAARLWPRRAISACGCRESGSVGVRVTQCPLARSCVSRLNRSVPVDADAGAASGRPSRSARAAARRSSRHALSRRPTPACMRARRRLSGTAAVTSARSARTTTASRLDQGAGQVGGKAVRKQGEGLLRTAATQPHGFRRTLQRVPAAGGVTGQTRAVRTVHRKDPKCCVALRRRGNVFLAGEAGRIPNLRFPAKVRKDGGPDGSISS